MDNFGAFAFCANILTNRGVRGRIGYRETAIYQERRVCMESFETILIGWNILVALVYGLDKLAAKQGGWRIRETALLTGAFLFGGFGAMAGMVMFHHKTSKMKFRILVPLAVVLNVVMIAAINGGTLPEIYNIF